MCLCEFLLNEWSIFFIYSFIFSFCLLFTLTLFSFLLSILFFIHFILFSVLFFSLSLFLPLTNYIRYKLCHTVSWLNFGTTYTLLLLQISSRPRKLISILQWSQMVVNALYSKIKILSWANNECEFKNSNKHGMLNSWSTRSKEINWLCETHHRLLTLVYKSVSCF